MDSRISIVTLGVKDLAKAKSFYQGLGWQLSSKSNDNICFFQALGMVLALYPWDQLAEDAVAAPEGTGFRGVTLAQNVRAKSDVKALLDKVKKSGGEIVKPAQDVFWGGHSGYFRDPDGHLWEIAWNPYWELSRDGALNLPN